ncbi:MAG: Fur family transcriptional regulator [Proteobacteria bacterium]|nr:Fur family transcriptional regulator [Pseudomonadota bacterium]
MKGPNGLTRNQGLVLGALADAKGPMTAYQLLDCLRADGFRAPLQVYRALSALIDKALIHRVESLNAFIMCRHPAADHSRTVAFAICRSCAKTIEFSDVEISDRIRQWSEETGFLPAAAILEVQGLCTRCRTHQAAN